MIENKDFKLLFNLHLLQNSNFVLIFQIEVTMTLEFICNQLKNA